jgi:hypothetical protein
MERRPSWLWPNVLSLDAPLVAVVWMWMFAKSWRVIWYPHTIYLLVAGVVWGIYVMDRLIDSRVREPEVGGGTPRHRFHGKHSRAFGVVLAVVAVVCLVLLGSLPPSLWLHGSFVLLFVVGYFMLAFLQDGGGGAYLKNALAGLAFAYGVTVGIHFYRPASNLFWLLISPEVLAFAVLCMLNITAIDFWEMARRASSPDEKGADELLLTLLLIVLAAFALLMAVQANEYTKPFYYAVMISAAALQVINRVRSRFSLDSLRVLADVAMLLPLPLFIVQTPPY